MDVFVNFSDIIMKKVILLTPSNCHPLAPHCVRLCCWQHRPSLCYTGKLWRQTHAGSI